MKERPPTVAVQYKCVEGYHVYTSPELPGLYVASKDAALAAADVAPAIRMLLEMDYGIST